MPYQFSSLTPNLIVADIERSLAFYRDILGFTVEQTVPDVSPFVFAIVRSGPVEVYLNAPAPATEEYPSLRGRSIGGSLTLFVEHRRDPRRLRDAEDARAHRDAARRSGTGVTEFACTDPDGYVITFAEQEP